MQRRTPRPRLELHEALRVLKKIIDYYSFLTNDSFSFDCSVVNEECYPYTSGQTGQVERCKVPRRGNLSTMKCQLVNAAVGSTRPSDKPQRKGLFRTPPAYRIALQEEDIMNEIIQRGPVQGFWPFKIINPKNLLLIKTVQHSYHESPSGFLPIPQRRLPLFRQWQSTKNWLSFGAHCWLGSRFVETNSRQILG